MTIHPARPPNQPYFRGISDLPGELGDLFYGPYGRSVNHYVASGSAVRKRDGYTRALDEQFEGSASVLYHRDGATKFQIVADGEGVKVLNSLPPSFYTGVAATHSGFANDPFTRANSNTVNAQDYPWIEGQDSDEVSGRTLGESMKIASNDCQLDSADGQNDGLDWTSRAPAVFHGYRIELDFNNLVLTAIDKAVTCRFFLGLPDIYLQDGGLTVGRERQYAVDANVTWSNSYPGGLGQDTCWQGMACEVSVVRQSGDQYRVWLKMSDFLSNKETSSNAIRSGRLDVVSENSSLSSAASQQTTWVLEFGRRQVSDHSWKREARLWKTQTIAAIEAGTATSANTTLTLTSGELTRDDQVSGFYRSLSKDGSGGFFGLVIGYNTAVDQGLVDIPEIKATLSLV